MSIRRIGSQSFYILFGSLVAAFVQWFVLLTISHSEGASGTGAYALAQSYVIPVSYIAWLSLRQQINVQSDGPYLFSDYLWLRAIVPLPLYGTVLGGMALLGSSASLLWLTAAVFALKYAEGFFDLAFGAFQASDRIVNIFKASAIRGAVSVPIFLLALRFSHDIALAVATLAVAWVVIFLLIELPRVHRGGETVSDDNPARPAARQRMKSLLFSSLPLGVSGFIMSLGSNVPRMVVDHFSGREHLGYFAAASHFLVVGSLATSAIGQAILPHLARKVGESDERGFFKLLFAVVVATLLSGVVAAPFAYLFGDWLLTTLYGPAFAGQQWVLVTAALAAGPVFAASIAPFGATAAKQFTLSAHLYMISVVVTLALSLVITPFLGVIGAFTAMGLASLFQVGMFLWILRRFWRKRSAGALAETAA